MRVLPRVQTASPSSPPPAFPRLARGAAILFVTALTSSSWAQEFRRGDVNNDGRVSIVDAVFLKNWLGAAGPRGPCERAADADASGALNITDVLATLKFLFEGAPAMPAPFPDCGADPLSPLGCDVEPECDEVFPATPGFTLFVSGSEEATEWDLGELEFTGFPAEEVAIPFSVMLAGDTEDSGTAQSWSFGLTVTSSDPAGASFHDVTVSGTPAEVSLVGGYFDLQTIGKEALVSAAILFLKKGSTFQPGSVPPILRGTVLATAPPLEAETTVNVELTGGLRGSGEAVPLEVVAEGDAYAPEVFPLRARIRSVDPTLFRRGDVTGEGTINITDPIYTLGWLFQGNPPPPCHDAADVNDSGKVDISDPINALNCLFIIDCGFNTPGPGCAPDPTEDALPCRVMCL
jgi:hypothetical protein